MLASEPRLRRRELAAQLLEAMQQEVKPGHRFTRLDISDEFPETAYIFLILPRPDYIKSYQEYREGRRVVLLAHCKVAKLLAPAAKRIVGIATEPDGTPEPSEDLLLLETHGGSWTAEDEQEARELQKLGSILVDGRTTRRVTSVREYPDD